MSENQDKLNFKELSNILQRVSKEKVAANPCLRQFFQGLFIGYVIAKHNDGKINQFQYTRLLYLEHVVEETTINTWYTSEELEALLRDAMNEYSMSDLLSM